MHIQHTTFFQLVKGTVYSKLTGGGGRVENAMKVFRKHFPS